MVIVVCDLRSVLIASDAIAHTYVASLAGGVGWGVGAAVVPLTGEECVDQ